VDLQRVSRAEGRCFVQFSEVEVTETANGFGGVSKSEYRHSLCLVEFGLSRRVYLSYGDAGSYREI
jgi:hypothetical protein